MGQCRVYHCLVHVLLITRLIEVDSDPLELEKHHKLCPLTLIFADDDVFEMSLLILMFLSP